MFVSADQLICHAIGDYLLQSDYMANEKTRKTTACLAHVLTYVLPFLFLTLSWKALCFIVWSHFIIDHWRLARYVCWAKNWLAPRWIRAPQSDDDTFTLLRNWPWELCTATGYPPDKPGFMAVWLMIIVDNTMHVLCNAAALRWLT